MTPIFRDKRRLLGDFSSSCQWRSSYVRFPATEMGKSMGTDFAILCNHNTKEPGYRVNQSRRLSIRRPAAKFRSTRVKVGVCS